MFKVWLTPIFLGLLCCVFMTVSCTKELSFDFSNEKKKLIINSTFAKGDRFKVSLQTSRNILDPSSRNEEVVGARVVIKDGDGKLLEVLTDKNSTGIYTSTPALRAFEGNRYNLEVSHPDWPGDLFTATSTVPFLGSNSNIDTSLINNGFELLLQIGAEIDDLGQFGDMYIFEVSLDGNNLASIVDFGEEVKIYGDQKLPKRLFLDDSNFNGQQKNLDFAIREGVPRDSIANIDELEIRMINSSQELFEYLKSLEEYEVAQNSIGTFNAPTIEIFSNIKKSGKNVGFGIFAGYNQKTLVLR